MAPVTGSTILAGVRLKLGGFGLLRVFPVLFKFGFRFGVVWVALRWLVVQLHCNYNIYIYIYILGKPFKITHSVINLKESIPLCCDVLILTYMLP